MAERIVAITREIGAALANCELTFLERESIDLARAREQHAAYRGALEAAGVEVEVLPPEDDLPDAVFVEDTAVVLDEIAILTRPGAASRRAEVSTVAAAIARHRRFAKIVEPGTIDGGDVLRVGRDFFVGRSSRTNAEGFAQFAAIVQEFGCRATAIDVTGCLHLKSAVTALLDDNLLIHPAWIDASALRRFRFVEVDSEEPFAANALVVNGIVHVSARSPRTRAKLESLGFATRTIDNSELEKAEGGLTCSSLIFTSRDPDDSGSRTEPR